MQPLVSVIMPAKNVERFIAQAILSVRRQDTEALQLIVIDDGSQDDTAAIVRRHMSEDSRVCLLSGEGRGPGAARNLGLAAALGRWVAVVDADDEILPDRLSRLLGVATDGAHMAADNLTAFYENGPADHIWLSGGLWGRPHTISLESFLNSGIEGTATDQPGYLKPLFDRHWLEERGLRYDESLTIGEDYDLVARALAAGAVYRYVPDAGYRYRRHSASTSHRITTQQLDTMIDAFERLGRQVQGPSRTALDRRIDSLRQDRRFIEIVDELKARRLSALWEAASTAGLRRRLIRAARDGFGRRLSGR